MAFPPGISHPRNVFPEKLRYLAVGIWNTIFGFACFWVLLTLFGRHLHYLLISLISSEIAVINAYLGYKLVVFRAPGGGAWELFRFHLTYAAAIGASILLMWLLVSHLGLGPIQAQAVTTAVVVMASYVAHRRFSFGLRPERKK